MFVSSLSLQTAILLQIALAVPPSVNNNNLQDEVNSLKYAAKMLAVHLEKWNNLFLTSLEPRMSTTASLLASIDSKVNNLQERAHVWDTFQLHVAAWNDQLATMDRKMDIISKGQEKMIALDHKINTITNIEYKVDNALKKIADMETSLKDATLQNHHIDHDILFGEFAARGILSTVKMVEKKLDRLLLSQQNAVIKTKSGEEKPKLSLKCHIPKNFEELLNDISSKIDVIFDRISGKEPNEYEVEEYVDGSGADENPSEMRQFDNKLIKKVVKRMNQPCKKIERDLEELLSRIITVENNSRIILDHSNMHNDYLPQLFSQCNNSSADLLRISGKIDKRGETLVENINKILESYFSEQRAHFESFLLKQINSFKNQNCPNNKPAVDIGVLNQTKINLITHESSPNDSTVFFDQKVYLEPGKLACEDLENEQISGVYHFGNGTKFNSKNRSYNEKYCLIRDDGLWTVIQRRDNYLAPQNFSLDWYDYKYGFGNLSRDFWYGNDFISELSRDADRILRIELEDFEGNSVWAEYSTFKIFPENLNYKLIVDGYTGNASDSFLSHNGSSFSTFDRKNDEAPECCPCAVSYGGGWWFNSCFESNLNGIYHKTPNDNGYFRGIIWEHWLGNYSLKKTLMMLKPKGKSYSTATEKIQPNINYETSTFPYYEDP